ncbi:hypothetical protein [Chitinophaga sp.]
MKIIEKGTVMVIHSAFLNYDLKILEHDLSTQATSRYQCGYNVS